MLIGDVYFCFTAYKDLEQEEAGDTYIHTFTLTPWPAGDTRYFYFHGEMAGVPAPSTSPIFGRSLYFTPGYFSVSVTHAWDEFQKLGVGIICCCPGCPYNYIVGRYQTPGQQLCTALIFRSLPLPHCAEVTAAFIKFTARIDKATTVVRSRISVEPDTNPPWWHCATEAEYFTRLAARLAWTSWDDIEPWLADNVYYSPDIASLLQALANQPAWQPYQNAGIFWEDAELRSSWWALNYRAAYSFTGDPAKAPELSVHYNHWQVREVT